MFDIKFETWLLIIVFISILLFIGVKPYLYWYLRSVPSVKALPFIGTFWAIFIPRPGSKMDLADMIMLGSKSHYEKNRRYYGNYLGAEPELCLLDLDMIKQVLLNEFTSFTKRPNIFDAKPFDNMAVSFVGDHWKHARSYLSPTFSTVKSKRMTPIIQQCCKCFVDILKEKSDDPEGVQVKEILENLSIDILGKSFFGLETDSQRNPDSEFVKYCKKLNFLNILRPNIMLKVLFPFLTPIMKLLDLNSWHSNDICDYFERLMNKVYEERKANSSNEFSNDFLQSMVQAEVSDTDTDRVSATGKKWNSKGLIRKEIIGNLVTLIFAGSATISTTLVSLFFCLASNTDVQEALYQELKDELGDEEEPTYEKIHDLKYLDMVLCESQRLYPEGLILSRKCSSDIVIDDLLIEKGINIQIPYIFLTRNPDIWPEPMKFIPERFSPENKKNIHPCAFMPFGAGPRNCVGMRLAIYEVKMITIYVVRNFLLRKTSTTPETLQYNVVGSRPYPFNLRFIPR